MNNGFLLLSRNIINSDVFASQKLLKIWIWCLCKANYKDRHVPITTGRGESIVLVKRGSFLFGRNKAEEELYIDASTIYKSIQKLKELEMINIQSNSHYSIVTICNYGTYQNYDMYKVTTKEQQSNNQVTAKEQPSNTTNKANKANKDNNIIKPDFLKFENYAKEVLGNKYPSYKFSITAKYEGWVDAGWRDGHGKPIKNWKTKLKNTIPHLKQMNLDDNNTTQFKLPSR